MTLEKIYEIFFWASYFRWNHTIFHHLRLYVSFCFDKADHRKSSPMSSERCDFDDIHWVFLQLSHPFQNSENSRRRHKNQRSEHVLGIILQYDFIQNHHLFDLVKMLSIKLLSMISSFRLGFEKWKVSSSTRTRFHVPRAIGWLPQKLHFLRWLCS